MLNKPNALQCLRVVLFFLFAGRAWQYLRWDVPLRSVLWSQHLMESVIDRFLGMSWVDYTRDPVVERSIELIQDVFGWIYVILAICTLVYRRKIYWLGSVFIAGSAGLLFHTILLWYGKGMQWPILIEYTTQIFLPILFVTLVHQWNPRAWKLLAKLAIAGTFIGHGIYAAGIFPQPGSFVQMSISSFGMGDELASSFVKLMGYLDFIAVIMIFIPRTERWGLWYCVVWGLLTAFARLHANFYPEIFWGWLDQWWFETAIRLCHGLLPLTLLMLKKD